MSKSKITFQDFKKFYINLTYFLKGSQSWLLEQEELNKISITHSRNFLYRRHKPGFIETIPNDLINNLEKLCFRLNCHYKEGFKDGFEFAKYLLQESDKK